MNNLLSDHHGCEELSFLLCNRLFDALFSLSGCRLFSRSFGGGFSGSFPSSSSFSDCRVDFFKDCSVFGVLSGLGSLLRGNFFFGGDGFGGSCGDGGIGFAVGSNDLRALLGLNSSDLVLFLLDELGGLSDVGIFLSQALADLLLFLTELFQGGLGRGKSLLLGLELLGQLRLQALGLGVLIGQSLELFLVLAFLLLQLCLTLLQAFKSVLEVAELLLVLGDDFFRGRNLLFEVVEVLTGVGGSGLDQDVVLEEDSGVDEISTGK